MDLTLSDEQKMIQLTAREFAEKELEPIAALADEEGRFPEEALRKLAQLGLAAMLVPEEKGGSGADSVSYCLAMMEIARVCASTSVAMGVTNMVCEAISHRGTREQIDHFIPPLASGEEVGAFALTEPGSGSDAASIRTAAVREGDAYRIYGTKVFTTSGSRAGVILMMATVDRQRGAKGITCFLIEKGTPGLRVGKIENKLGLRGSETAELICEGCVVPLSSRLGAEGEGFTVAMESLDGGRLGIASQAVGIARACLEASVTYARQRTQFGRPIAEFQAIQWMIADTATELEAARWMTLRASSLKDRGRLFTPEAAMAKLYASEMVNRATARAIQIHGGYGYIKDYPVERYFRDARVTTLYEGTSEIQRLVIARHLLLQLS